ncbi:hypothetical protein EVJ58_g3931 [Rhodofomes roseus]|uniref:Uncharacterized protein n=1 Tax=Rhodofomes roseus TaxID=34475 RepID=A0A4Y9YMV7_9APHY|nr:hypothetical protein EVJ58_g3931 [Rhodofomes roseus]
MAHSENTLDAVLSDVASAHLKQLYINILLDDPEPFQTAIEETSERANTPCSTSDFHYILSHSVFDRLPATDTRYSGAHITVSFPNVDKPPGIAVVKSAFISAIKPHVAALFAPWLKRRVVEVEFYPDPDSEWRITRTSKKARTGHGESP